MGHVYLHTYILENLQIHIIYINTKCYMLAVNLGFYSHKFTFFRLSLDALLKCSSDAHIEYRPYHLALLTVCLYLSPLGFGSTFSAAEESVMMIPASPENISKQYKVSSQARTRYLF